MKLDGACMAIFAVAVVASGSAVSSLALGSQAMAPGYRSWAWTRQDWRSVVVRRGALDWSRHCGAEGTRGRGGTPALCLPLVVIERLSATAEGRGILVGQALRKAAAKPGERVRWHPEIARLHRELEGVTPADDPRLRGRKVNS